jgi:hypothetical protein
MSNFNSVDPRHQDVPEFSRSKVANDGGDGSGIPKRHHSNVYPVDANDDKFDAESNSAAGHTEASPELNKQYNNFKGYTARQRREVIQAHDPKIKAQRQATVQAIRPNKANANDNKLFTERLHSRSENGIFEPSDNRGQGHSKEVQSAQAEKNEKKGVKGSAEKSGWGNKYGHGNIIHAHGTTVE